MRRSAVMWVSLGAALAAAATAHNPPPPPAVWEAQIAFFAALPGRFPTSDIARFERLVAENVEVYRDGKLAHRTRGAWIAELQSYKPRTPDDPQGFSVSRDQYHETADGGVSVREFTYPIAPEGAQIVYHPHKPIRYVVYQLKDGRLARVDYGPAMSSYAGLCQAVQKAKANKVPSSASAAGDPSLCR